MKGIATILIFLFIFLDARAAENNFEPIPANEIQKYHFDLETLFFRSPESAKSEQAELNNALTRLENLKGKVSDSPNSLLNSFDLYNKALVLFFRNYTYFYLRGAINTKDKESSEEASRLDADFNRRTAFFQTELTETTDAEFEDFVKQNPKLEKFRFAVMSGSRLKPHQMSLPEEELLSQMSPYIHEWQFELYQEALSKTQFEDLKTPTGTLNVRKDRTEISSNPDRAIRESGFKKLYSGYESQRDLYAFALINLVKAENQIAQQKQFQNGADAIYFRSFWNQKQVSDLLNRISSSAEVYKRYQTLRADHVKKLLGYSDVNLWDLQATTSTPPRYTIDEASTIIRNALAKLGGDYSRELQALLDPANGRMDIVSGRNRRSGGFSKGFPGVPTVFFASGYQGFYNDMRILTHESTHAIHRQLMKGNNVLPVYAEGPHFLFESFAMFNELLLPDSLYENEKDPALRSYYLEQFFDGKGMSLFSVGLDAALEQAIYDGVQKGEIKNADDLDNVTEKIVKQYSIWADKHKELRMRWITNSLFYEDPIYQINYVYGALLTLKYYSMFLNDPNTFVPRYIALMKNGFNAPPEELLKKFLDIDLNNPKLLVDDVELLTKKVNLLEREYTKN